MPFFWNYYIKSCYFCLGICKKLWKDTFNKTSLEKPQSAFLTEEQLWEGRFFSERQEQCQVSDFQRICLNEAQKWTEGKYTKSCEIFSSFSQDKETILRFDKMEGGEERREKEGKRGTHFLAWMTKASPTSLPHSGSRPLLYNFCKQ